MSDRERDAVLAMLGVGREIWEKESGDAFIERLRAEESDPPPPPAPNSDAHLQESVWERIVRHQNQAFNTVTGLPLTYTVEGSGIWFFRDGQRINRKLTRKQVEIAVSRCPLSATTEINDLIDYPYLFALLRDERIRAGAW